MARLHATHDRIAQRGLLLLVCALEAASVGCGNNVSGLPAADSGGSGASGTSYGTSSGPGVGGVGGAAVEGPGAILDPRQVYVVGDMKAGVCNSVALVSWQSPELVATGFDCSCEFSDAKVRPTDGRMLMRCYDTDFKRVLREFHCDDCPYEPGQFSSFPEDPAANDPSIPSRCQDLAWFKMAPDGTVLHVCTGEYNRWLDQDGALVFEDSSGDALVHLGYIGRALTQKRIVELGSGVSVDIVGLPDGEMVAARAVEPDGFHVAMFVGQDEYTEADYHEFWQIDAGGVATFVGTYPGLQAGYSANPRLGQLDDSGAFFQHVVNAEVGSIVRRDVGGLSEIVYATDAGVLVSVSSYGFPALRRISGQQIHEA